MVKQKQSSAQDIVEENWVEIFFIFEFSGGFSVNTDPGASCLCWFQDLWDSRWLNNRVFGMRSYLQCDVFLKTP